MFVSVFRFTTTLVPEFNRHDFSLGREEIPFFVKASGRQSFYQTRYDARGNVPSLRLSSCIAFLSRASNKAANLRPAFFDRLHQSNVNGMPK